jgi:hypothetical protein
MWHSRKFVPELQGLDGGVYADQDQLSHFHGIALNRKGICASGRRLGLACA